MMLINHRINTLKLLSNVPSENGIEVDVRYHNNDLILHHNPFKHHETHPELFENLLKEWKCSGYMILNIKTEGIEQRCIDLMNKYAIKKWFFLDLSMPYFAIFSEKAKNLHIKGFCPDNLAVRFSEREPIEYALSYAGKAKWVWIDCFSFVPLSVETYKKLKKLNFKICIVSPELQNHPKNKIADFKLQLNTIDIDAVCTKYPEMWI